MNASAGLHGWDWPRALLAVVIGFVGIYEHAGIRRRISELADMDFAVLLDDVPLETYADKVSAPCSRPPTKNRCSQEAACVSASRTPPSSPP